MHTNFWIKILLNAFSYLQFHEFDCNDYQHVSSTCTQRRENNIITHNNYWCSDFIKSIKVWTWIWAMRIKWMLQMTWNIKSVNMIRIFGKWCRKQYTILKFTLAMRQWQFITFLCNCLNFRVRRWVLGKIDFGGSLLFHHRLRIHLRVLNIATLIGM